MWLLIVVLLLPNEPPQMDIFPQQARSECSEKAGEAARFFNDKKIKAIVFCKKVEVT